MQIDSIKVFLEFLYKRGYVISSDSSSAIHDVLENHLLEEYKRGLPLEKPYMLPKVNPTEMELVRIEAFKQFECRKSLQVKKIDNASLVAGEPMHFYCEHCGIETDILPEGYLFPPIKVCSQCKGMEKQKWLPEAFPWQFLV